MHMRSCEAIASQHVKQPQNECKFHVMHFRQSMQTAVTSNFACVKVIEVTGRMSCDKIAL